MIDQNNETIAMNNTIFYFLFRKIIIVILRKLVYI